MSKGLSKLQKDILKVINEMPGSGGNLTDVYDRIKLEIYPKYYGRGLISHPRYQNNNVVPLVQQSSRGYYSSFVKYVDNRQVKITQEEFRKNKAELNKIRVTMSVSVRGLLKRQLLSADADIKEYRYGIRNIFITDTGKAIINADDFVRINI